MCRKWTAQMYIHRLVVFLVFLSKPNIVHSQNIEWVVANAGESQAESCARLGFNPLNMGDVDFIWNSTIFRNVVTDTLNRTVLNPDEPFGAVGCCAPGLWCEEDGCFTQGFGSHLSNYGWLNNNPNACPVYTCSGSRTSTAVISSASLNDGTLTLRGVNFTTDSATSAAFVYGESCGELDYCSCVSCPAFSPCPPGSLCLRTASRSLDVYYCFPLCAGVGDNSCACGNVCTVVGGEGPTTVAMCLPENYNARLPEYHSQCSTASGHATCSAPRAYQASHQGEYTAKNQKVDVSMVIDDTGAVLASGTSTDLARGFCQTDAECFDGNICTSDNCAVATGLCQYASIEGCHSVLPAVTARTTPYMYYSYYAQGGDLAATQAQSVAYLLANGERSSTADRDDSPLQEVPLPFSVVYFGNLVSTGYISPNGVLALPPAMRCGDGQCFLLTSASNVISPFYTDWHPGGSVNTQIMFYTQTATDPAIWGVSGREAFHVLFNDVRRYRTDGAKLGAGPNTFAASLYADGSVRLSYVTITTQFKEVSDFFGLWGAYASSDGAQANTVRRYHMEAVGAGNVVNASEAVYCPLGALACPLEACLATGETLVALWDGATTCDALGDAYALRVQCSFAGGVAVSAAQFNATSEGTLNSSTVRCEVPLLEDFTPGAVVSVDIIVTAVRLDDTSREYNENTGAMPGTKSVYVAYMGNNDEVGRASLMIRYYSSGGLRNGTTCGCNALPQYAGAMCDRMGVCGGRNTTGDCAGYAFGSAITTDCSGGCVGGMTGTTPTYNCENEDSDPSLNEIITQTIILLMVICCLMFLTVSVTYSIRRMLALRAMRDELHRFNEQLTMAESEALRRHIFGAAGGAAGARGLSEFERDALGKVTFSTEFYERHKREMAAALHSPVVTKADDMEQGKVAEQALIAGDTVATAPPTVAENCECTICLSEIEEGNEVRVLPAPCGHIFHVDCIDQWFEQSFLCPLCKRSIRGLLLGGEEEQALREEEEVIPLQDLLLLRHHLAVRLIPSARSRLGIPSRPVNLPAPAPAPAPGVAPSFTAVPPTSTHNPEAVETGESGAAELVPSIRFARQHHRHLPQRGDSRNFSPSRVALRGSPPLGPPSPVLIPEDSGDLELAAVTPRIRTDDGAVQVGGAGTRAHIRYEGMPLTDRDRSDSDSSSLA